ncbi:aldo/keto reductase [Ketogulonicigenium vulgare]|nr:aldo/keto reductase [Ketogulonicigenium vulgare]ALJ82239.1 aldo/keto reductase [Ketogulonicigenium vulgare]ANW34898.1 aldo/keto reductase [Ketogulonicigenium vulgare]
MKTYTVPHTNLQMSSVVLGMMRIAQMENTEIRALFDAAVAAGINTFDHADIYGGARHGCETRFGEAITLSAAQREQIVIQSKVGIRPGYFDFSREHILRTVDGSLAALKTDYLDVLLLHRPDALVEPEEVAEAFDTLYAAGKVRHFGVSNHTPGQIELLKRTVRQPLRFNQMQLSITHSNLIAQGIAANMGGLAQSVSRDIGLMDYTRLNGMVLQAWSPFQKAFFDGTFIGDRENYGPLNEALDQLAAAHGVTPTGIAVAWITRHPANIQVVLGTTKPARITECVAGAGVTLSREEWYRLFTAAGHTLP